MILKFDYTLEVHSNAGHSRSTAVPALVLLLCLCTGEADIKWVDIYFKVKD